MSPASPTAGPTLNSLLIACALSVASLIYATAIESPPWGLGLIAAHFIGAFYSERLRLQPVHQLVIAFAVATVAGSLVFSVVDSGGLHPLFALLALASLAIAASRLVFAEPIGGPPATLALGVVAVLACGTVSSERFATLVALFLVVAVISSRLADRGLVRWDRARPKRRWGTVLAFLIAPVLAVLLAAVIPRLHDWVEPWTPAYSGARRAGFSGRNFQLGSLRRLLRSDRVVMRVHGHAPTHLRGEVYRRYDAGTWVRDSEKTTSQLTSEFDVETAVINDAQRGDVWVGDAAFRHVFLPLGWTAFHSEPPETRWTSTGIVRAARGQTIKQYSFAVGVLPRVPPRDPTGIDREVPLALLTTLRPLAETWTAGATTDRERLLAIQERLSTEFTYSTDYLRTGDDDYLLQFFEDRRGHCEYFASAMAILGRCVGVPTRVVGGFHVSERHPFGDYAVVRERNAHAWIEAYLPDEGWVTFDPTPPGEITYASASLLSAVADWIGDQLRRRGPLGLVIPLGVVLAIVLLRALLRRRRGGVRRSPALDYAATPAVLEEFLTKLAEGGFVRASHEPWERLRHRLRAAGEHEVAGLVDRTIHWRYGVTDGEAVADEVRNWLRAPRWQTEPSNGSH